MPYEALAFTVHVPGVEIGIEFGPLTPVMESEEPFELESVTVKFTVLLVPFALATYTGYVPGVINRKKSGHIIPAVQFAPIAVGTVNVSEY